MDSGEIIIRGGSHLDFSFIPNQAFGASLRGPDMIDWYTTAWFDKYLKHERSADKRLLTNRWRDEPLEAEVDPNKDGNAFSFYYLSRLDIHLSNGQKWDCENLRKGCPGMVAGRRLRGALLLREHRHDARKVTGSREPAGPSHHELTLTAGQAAGGALCLTPFGRTSPARDRRRFRRLKVDCPQASTFAADVTPDDSPPPTRSQQSMSIETIEKCRLVTRSDFDGLVCAALLKELGVLDGIKFVHPKDIQDGLIELGDHDITTNLPYVPGVRLAFDHHHSETLRVTEKVENHIIDARRAIGRARRLRLLRWRGKVPERLRGNDAGGRQGRQRAVLARGHHDPDGWILLSFLMDPRTGLGRFRDFRISNYQLMMDLVDACLEHGRGDPGAARRGRTGAAL